MKSRHSMHLVLSAVFVLLLAPMLNGCVLLLLGGGAAGGYAVSKDEVVGAVDVKKDKVFRVAKEVAMTKGIIKLQDPTRGYIETSVDDVTVKIHIDQITEKSVQLKVEARNKYKMPKVAVAQDVYTEILKKVG